MTIENHIYIHIPEASIHHAGLSCVIKGLVIEYDAEMGDWRYNLETTDLYNLQGQRIGRVAVGFEGLSGLTEGLADWLAMKAEEAYSPR